MAENDETAAPYPASVDDVTLENCTLWGELAAAIEAHVLATKPESPAQVIDLMRMAAQAEACRWRSTGDCDPMDVNLNHALVVE